MYKRSDLWTSTNKIHMIIDLYEKTMVQNTYTTQIAKPLKTLQNFAECYGINPAAVTSEAVRVLEH